MLTALRLENFKSFKDERIELGPTTLLLGANASGKSNFLDALRFLQGLALGFSVEEVLGGRSAGGREIWPGIRGGAKEIGFRGAKEFRLTSEWRVGEDGFRYEITCSVLGHPVVVSEKLTALPDGRTLLVGSLILEEESYFYSGGAQSGKEVTRARFHDWTTPGLAGISQSVLDLPKSGPRTRSIDPLDDERRRIGVMQKELRGLSVLEALPRRMRDYVAGSTSELGTSGENLSSVLASLADDPEQRIALVDWLTELCGPEIADIDFSRTDLDDVMLVLVDAAGARTSARSLSDGTLRFLALLVALRDTAKSKVLLLEEIESGLHPARLHLLVEQLEARAQTPGAQVIATTHSPTLLAALAEPTLRDAVVFAAAPEHEGTIMRRLGDLSDFDEVVRRRGIEHLFTTRWLERAL